MSSCNIIVHPEITRDKKDADRFLDRSCALVDSASALMIRGYDGDEDEEYDVDDDDDDGRNQQGMWSRGFVV